MMYHCFAMSKLIPQCAKILMMRCTSQLTPLSTPKKNTPKNATVTITTQVVTNTSCRVGQVTWRISTRTSCRKPRQRLGCSARRPKKPSISSGEPRPSVSSVFNFPACVAIARFSLRPQPFSVSGNFFSASSIACQNGRGGGIRTPTLGFGDRWSTVEPTPLKSLLHFLVARVLAARLAKFLRFHPVGMLLPVLSGRVVPVFAIVALQRNNFAHKIPSDLFDDFRNRSRADRVAAFANREAQPLLQGHRRDQADFR